jgi:hypothetical protein
MKIFQANTYKSYSNIILALAFLFFAQVSSLQAQAFRVKNMLPIDDGTIYLCATDNTFGNFIGKPYSATEVVYTGYTSARRTALRKVNAFVSLYNQTGTNSALSLLRKWRRIYKQLAKCWNARGAFAIDTSNIDPNIFKSCDIINGIASSSSYVKSDDSYKSDTIINGTACSNENTAVVELIINDSDGSQGLCTGTVVNQRTIIAAGHCLEGDVESVDILTKNAEFNTETFHVHPNYGQDEIEINDVSIIISDQDLGTNTFDILSNTTLVVDELGIIAGYGQTETGRSEQLRAAPVLIDSFTTEAIRIRYSGNNDFGNTCSGDSGGPLFVKRGSEWFLAGITSNGVKTNCGPGDLSNFANLLDPDNKYFINTYVPGLIP